MSLQKGEIMIVSGCDKEICYIVHSLHKKHKGFYVTTALEVLFWFISM